MAAVPAHSAGPRSRHRKRFSVSRLSSDTTATLPEYRQTTWSLSPPPEPYDQPPDYPDSADEADEETDDCFPISPLASPRRKRFSRISSQSRVGAWPYQSTASQSDTFLDSLLERSVNALELSNALLQSSMTTKTSLGPVLGVDHSPDRILDARARVLSDNIRNNKNVHKRWMDDLDGLAKGVEELCDDDDEEDYSSPFLKETDVLSRSLPAAASVIPHRNARRPSVDSIHLKSDTGRLVSDAKRRVLSSPPPRALTQYVTVQADQGDALETTSDTSHIFLPSTIGLRSSPHVSDFKKSLNQPSSSSPDSSPPHFTPLSRHRSHSPASSQFTVTGRYSRSPTPTCRPDSSVRSRSWSSEKVPSPKSAALSMPPTIEELPSHSDSSSDSHHPVRTLEHLRRILDKSPAVGEQSTPSRRLTRTQSLKPRSPPVVAVTSTSTTTTSISRLLTKGSHSTSTRPRSPPRTSSLKKRPSPLSSAGPSTLSIPELVNGGLSPSASNPSSGRSTPRNVSFGPLPESHRERTGNGVHTKFQEQQEAKSRARKRRRGSKGNGAGKIEPEKEKDGESSWWTTWLTGGSMLSMSAAKQEERAEDRMARWSRPGMGLGFEDWPV